MQQPKYNRLLSRKARLGYAPGALLEHRGSGKTTAAILLALGEAILRPGQWVVVKDPDLDGTAGRANLSRASIHTAASKLGLRHIESRVSHVEGVRQFGGPYHELQVRSNHFTDNPWEIE